MAKVDPRVFSHPHFRTVKGLPFLYMLSLGISLTVILLYRKWGQFVTPGALFLSPLWLLIAHLLCGFSYVVTSLSPKKGLRLLLNSWLVYTRQGSVVYLQVAFLTSLLEEVFFRYFLLTWLNGILPGLWPACLLTSLIFSLFHFRHGFSLNSAFRYLDFFLFSLVISLLNLSSDSFYPAFFIHGMRNYILKVLLISREDYQILHKKKNPPACKD